LEKQILKNAPRYWKKILIQESLATPDCPTDDATGQAVVSVSDLLQGRFPRSGLPNFVRDRSTNNKAVTPTFPISVLVAPWVIERNRSKTANTLDEPQVIFWIPAYLHEDGTLVPIDNGTPFLNRNLQRPSGIPRLEVIDQEEYVKNSVRQEYWKQGWPELINRLEKEFAAQVGCGPSVWIPDGYRISKGVVRQLNDNAGANKERDLIRLCDEMIRAPNGLTESLLQPVPAVDSAIHRESGRLGCYLTKEFPLNPKQADVANSVAVLPVGRLLAVNGPPGTGKTSMLTGIVGDVVVRAVVENKEAPVIVLTSTNNQAVTNALEEFSKPANATENLGSRWMPDVGGYGVYMPSAKAKSNSEKIDRSALLVTLRSTVFTTQFVERANDTWRRNFRRWLGHSMANFEAEVEQMRQYCLQVADTVAKTASRFDYLKSTFDRGEYRQLEALQINLSDSLIPQARAAAEESQRKLETTADFFEKLTLKSEEMVDAAKSDWIGCSLAERIFMFVPAVRRTVLARIRMATERAGLHKSVILQASGPEQFVQKLENYCQRILKDYQTKSVDTAANDLRDAKKTLDSFLSEEEDCRIRLQELDAKILALGKDVQGIDKSTFDDGTAHAIVAKALDNGLRRRAFDMAMRFREGEFILKGLQGLHDQENWPKGWGKGTRQKGEQYFRQLARISPVFAGTVYKVASELSWWDRNKQEGDNITALRDFVDLLVIDESGQVAPHLGLPLFALAQRALVVGDVFQLEPVVNVVESVSFRIAANEVGGDVDRFLDRGLMSHAGSVMKAAQGATYATDTDIRAPGIMLREHFRCAESIISYCNDLVYGGALIPKVPDQRDPFIPHLASGHIRGKASKSNGSWCNRIEASTITEWIWSRKEQFLAQYPGKKLSDIVAVVTPFNSQKVAISKKLRERLGDMANGITVGTVHALQGAEKPIVIFSLTVTAEEGGSTPFFDRGSNMMNVAVSRAKDAFVVMGDLTLLDAQTSTPSGLLARHFLRNPSSRLEDVVPVYNDAVNNLTNVRLADWKAHDAALKDILEGARQKVLLSSFNYAFPIPDRPDVHNWIMSAARRGIAVTIFLGLRPKDDHDEARLKFKNLSNAGVKLLVAGGIHTKTILADDDTIIEGSFNWLAAWGGVKGFRESSILLTGLDAVEHVERAWKEFGAIEQRINAQSKRWNTGSRRTG
jgi:hypothetical protein